MCVCVWGGGGGSYCRNTVHYSGWFGGGGGGGAIKAHLILIPPGPETVCILLWSELTADTQFARDIFVFKKMIARKYSVYENLL